MVLTGEITDITHVLGLSRLYFLFGWMVVCGYGCSMRVLYSAKAKNENICCGGCQAKRGFFFFFSNVSDFPIFVTFFGFDGVNVHTNPISVLRKDLTDMGFALGHVRVGVLAC